jgi:hypothetical protein
MVAAGDGEKTFLTKHTKYSKKNKTRKPMRSRSAAFSFGVLRVLVLGVLGGTWCAW